MRVRVLTNTYALRAAEAGFVPLPEPHRWSRSDMSDGQRRQAFGQFQRLDEFVMKG